MGPSHSQTADKPSKPKVISFFHLQKLKGTQPTKTPAMRAVHLEEEGSDKVAHAISEDPAGIDGVMEDFIVCLARVVKEAQQDKKHCYHCSSTEHFICECVGKGIQINYLFKSKEGTLPEKGAQTPQVKMAKLKAPQEGMPKA